MNEADSFAEIFRGGLPHCLLIVLSMLLICSPVMPSEFEVISMSKFDLNGQHFGSRVSSISLEARSLYSWNTSRHCVLTRLTDLSIHDFDKLRQNAGGIILMLPSNMLDLDVEARELITILEQSMLTYTAVAPIFFAPYNKDLEKIIDDITYTTTDNVAQNQTALSQLIVTVSANRYHVNVGGGSIVANKNSKVPIIHGELIPNQLALKPSEPTVGDGQKLPVILITANLKTFGIFNDYPVNADAAVLLVLMELFSKLHYTSNMAPKYRLRFLLSDAGVLLNFQGSKKWLEIDDNALQNVEFVLCLDTITESLSLSADNALFMHVSKPPKEKTSISNFFKLLKAAAEKYSNGLIVEGVHKKINLADTKLAWEHERFSIKRYPSFTLSSVKSPRSPIRTTIFKNDESLFVEHTLNTSRVIAEALASYMYKVDPISSIFDGQLAIKEENLLPYFGVKSILHNNDVKDAFEKYLNNVKIIYDKPDARDPEFMFYNENDVKLNVYRVKPAIFDLFLTIVIGVYLLAVFLAIQYFPRFYDEVSKLTKEEPAGQQNGHSSERLRMKSH